MATVASPPSRDFSFFLEIIDAFKMSADSASSKRPRDMQVAPFASAMTVFLRVFDAFSNPFFSEVVKKDVEGNITKLRAAAGRHNATTLDEVLSAEAADAALFKLIKAEKGAGCNAGSVALLWMKRAMQFVIGLLRLLVDDESMSLSAASRKSYAGTLRYCHNFVTRGVFDTGLRFAPTRENFYKNLGGGEGGRVGGALREFLEVFEPQLKDVVEMYKERGLEPYIK